MGPARPDWTPIDLPGQTSKNPSGGSPIPTTVGFHLHPWTLGARFRRMNLFFGYKGRGAFGCLKVRYEVLLGSEVW